MTVWYMHKNDKIVIFKNAIASSHKFCVRRFCKFVTFSFLHLLDY